MASGTNSAARRLQAPEIAIARIGRAARERAIPLLVVRVPAFAQTAWRSGAIAARRLERRTARAFRLAACDSVRAADSLIHEWGSDTFLVAMLGGGRNGGSPRMLDCRTALDRLVARIGARGGEETGWWTVEGLQSRRDLERAAGLALERGRRERERYEFLATVGHELRTPLASIRGYLESVLECGLEHVNSRSFLETARREALRLGAMIDGMLEFSLLDLTPPSLSSPECDVAALVQTSIETLAPLAAARDTALRCDVASHVVARIEPDACLHAIGNLIENAIRHGRERGTVSVSCRERTACVEILVADDGPGFQGRVRGHGLGLRIARTIVERAGGSIDLGCAADRGTFAILRLPRTRPREAEGRRGSS